MSLMTLQEISKYRSESLPCSLIDQSTYVSTESMLADKRGITAISKKPSSGNVKRYYKNDVLVSNIRPYFKKVWLAEYDGTCSNDVLVFHSTGCLPNFLYLLLSSDAFFSYMTKTSKGTKMPRGDKRAIMKYEVKVPNLQTQLKICEIIDTFQSKIKVNQQLNDYLASIGESIWKETSISSKLIFKVSDVVKNIITGKTPSTKNPEYYGRTYPFITIPDMHSSIWICSSERYLSESGNAIQIKKLVPRGSVLISCIATVGLVGITRTPSHFNQQINAVIAAHEGEEFFLYYALKSIRNKLLGIGATGSATLNINRSAFANIEIPWLDDTSMKKYIKEVKPLFDLIENNSMESLRLQRTKEILLSKLLVGELDVSNINLH